MNLINNGFHFKQIQGIDKNACFSESTPFPPSFFTVSLEVKILISIAV